ncbi:ribonuclease H2 non-catalytic subunit-domain-containing protein [Tricharina praecox]|uniref:ribonuclease H2 non-catalytic subunit-domain-containing protein n=1 Tax=Tricharina praecox TaxID=43433 RepID=UPI00221E878E|nr:ribonuclease H2 non-catalytic subunit-domain-containing protein [Tricharina praecox]KAI5853844.1 ribonuclease H2 non-catalytic subunit-domain-containing protein [Tricharina praecox]
MLSLTPPTITTPKAVVNLLPCRLHHTGPANATPAHWSPTRSSSSTTQHKTSYFRGRRLLAKELLLPAGYTGCVLAPTDQVITPTADEEGEDGEGVETKAVEVLATFDGIDVWGHEQVPQDDYGVVRAAEEWVLLAARVNTFDDEEEEEQGEGGKK